MSELDQLLLPFAEREYISVPRTCRILDLGCTAVYDLYHRGLIEMIDYRPRARKRVRYQSVVALCDDLRKRYCIKDRRQPLSNPMLRHRDEDLLPFPSTDTISIQQTMNILGYSSATPIYYMIDEGRFDAYQFSRSTPWRISKSSLSVYIQRVRDRQRITPLAVNSRLPISC